MKRPKVERRGGSMITKSKMLGVLMISLTLCIVACSGKKAETEEERTVLNGTSSKQQKIEILKDVALDAEFVKVSTLGKIAKVDVVEPELDTCSMRVILYDMEKDRILSETKLPEGGWITGLTQKGFYAIEQYGKTVYLYDKDGSLTTEKSIQDSVKWSSMCAVSEDEIYLVCSDTFDLTVHIYNLETNQKQSIDTEVALRGALGFKDGVLYAECIGGGLAEICIENLSVEIALQDNRLNCFTPDYCMGTTEYSFIVALKEKTEYVPLDSVDKLIVGVGKNGFATTVSNEDGDLLRIYDIKEKNVSEMTFSETVESIVFTEDEKILAIVGDISTGTHKIYMCDMKNLENKAIEVNETDTPKMENPAIQIPKGEASANATMIKGVPVIAQFPEYPTGCESVSTVMALNFMGHDITVEQFVDQYLPKSMDFYRILRKRYGPSPYEYFIGNPKTSASYGCMAPVIERALHDYLGNHSQVINVTGSELSKLCSAYIDKGIPVIVWATINMLETVSKNSWYLEDDSLFTWPGNEHCMLLVGYDEKYYYFNDPYAGEQVQYEKQLTEERYMELGKQAIVVLSTE